MMPITVVKVRYESDLYNYKTISSAFSSIVRKEGVKALFIGYGVTAMRDAPFAGIYIFFYEKFKAAFLKSRVAEVFQSDSQSHIFVNLSAGLLSGISATALTHPFDTLKTRLQLEPEKFKNIIVAFKKLAQMSGFRGFFVGMLPRVLRKSLSSAVSWTVYEELIRRYS